MRSLSYFVWFAATVLTLASLSIALGIGVDPYRMYGTPVVPGWTALKPQIYKQASLAKTYQLERVGPATLLLGNSRVEIGFDPESPHWPAAAHPVFNAALAGGGLDDCLLMLRSATAVHPPSTVILGLDILDFLQRPDHNRGLPQRPDGPDERRLVVDTDGHPNPKRFLQLWRDRITTTLTIDAIFDALATPFDQNPETSATMTPLGFDPLHEYRIFVWRQGYYQLFSQKNAIYHQQYKNYPAPDFAEPLDFPSFRYLQAIIELASSYGENLILFIHPYHVDYLEMLHDVGLWRSFENWKRALARFVDAQQQTRHASVRVIDFSGYNEISSEHVPPPGDRHTAMRWY